MKNLKKSIIRFLSLALGIFTFTACYGVPYDVYDPDFDETTFDSNRHGDGDEDSRSIDEIVTTLESSESEH